MAPAAPLLAALAIGTVLFADGPRPVSPTALCGNHAIPAKRATRDSVHCRRPRHPRSWRQWKPPPPRPRPLAASQVPLCLPFFPTLASFVQCMLLWLPLHAGVTAALMVRPEDRKATIAFVVGMGTLVAL